MLVRITPKAPISNIVAYLLNNKPSVPTISVCSPSDKGVLFNNRNLIAGSPHSPDIQKIGCPCDLRFPVGVDSQTSIINFADFDARTHVWQSIQENISEDIQLKGRDLVFQPNKKEVPQLIGTFIGSGKRSTLILNPNQNSVKNTIQNIHSQAFLDSPRSLVDWEYFSTRIVQDSLARAGISDITQRFDPEFDEELAELSQKYIASPYKMEQWHFGLKESGHQITFDFMVKDGIIRSCVINSDLIGDHVFGTVAKYFQNGKLTPSENGFQFTSNDKMASPDPLAIRIISNVVNGLHSYHTNPEKFEPPVRIPIMNVPE